MRRIVTLLFHDVFVRDPGESGFSSPAAHRYKLPLSRFDRHLEQLRAARSDAPLLASPDIFEAAAANRTRDPFLVTVDDGGVSYHRWIADRFERHGWRGHCFVSTDFIGREGFLTASHLRELDRRGHVIGAHSASHPARFSALPFDRMVDEWSRSCRMLEDFLGKAVDVASVPGGYFSPTVTRAAYQAGIRVLFTSEPIRRVANDGGCLVIGRFTLRRGDPDKRSQRLVSSPWARAAQWANWNAKGLVKPLLGPSYVRIADRLLTPRTSGGGNVTWG